MRDCVKDCELKNQGLHVKIKFVTVRKVASGKMQLLLVFVRTEIHVRTLHKYLQIIIS